LPNAIAINVPITTVQPRVLTDISGVQNDGRDKGKGGKNPNIEVQISLAPNFLQSDEADGCHCTNHVVDTTSPHQREVTKASMTHEYSPRYR
jgi:hypothetical protein